MEITRKEFQKWLRDNWDKSIGVQEDGSACAIAQFVIHKIPNAHPEIVQGDCSYYLEESGQFKVCSITRKQWMDEVIAAFDSIPRSINPCGADLLKAMGWDKHE
jgi:hypothetical protein